MAVAKMKAAQIYKKEEKKVVVKNKRSINEQVAKIKRWSYYCKGT